MSATAVKSVELTREQLLQLHGEAESEYPNECCGIIFGTERVDGRRVTRLERVRNDFDDAERYHRFSISPQQLLDAERAAAANAELVLGFYHSHPDHPPVPSEYDREHAWPFYSYIIVAVETGRAAATKSWQLDEHSQRFDPQPLNILSDV